VIMTDDDGDDVTLHSPFQYITRNQLYDLWGAGFTVIRRGTFGMDLYATADRVCRPGMAQQWCDAPEVEKFKATGWAVVPAERYPGLFAPYPYVGEVKIGNLVLMECPAHKVGSAKAAQVAAAHKQVDDWKAKWGGEFSGEVKVGGERTEIGATKTIENTTAIPRDMVPYIAQIFEERDRIGRDYAYEWREENPTWSSIVLSNIATLFDTAMAHCPSAPKWPTLNAIILPYAIENVRKRIIEEATSGQAS